MLQINICTNFRTIHSESIILNISQYLHNFNKIHYINISTQLNITLKLFDYNINVSL